MLNARDKRSGSLLSRTAGLLLALILSLTLIPLSPRAEAASWVDPYLEQVRSWGVMKGDDNGDLHPERNITRAEFVTMLNRAFGYTETGPNPFSDVPDNAWFRNSICTAYKAGYFFGTDTGKAAPDALVTREQAVVMLGRTLRIPDQPGISTRFHDSLEISNWARGCVQGASSIGVIDGFPDGTFRPRNPITRGETAAMLVKALGNLINRPGSYDLGGVYGNLTITTPEVELKNSVISGNLYLTGGVGLESLSLENVRIMGEIIICGAGSSQKGESSVILRNVIAPSLTVDTVQDYPISIRAEGLTDIPVSTIRTSAFVEDMTGRDLGLGLIQMEGDRKVDLKLAGNIKEVINRAPASNLVIAQGSAQKVTMDEHALESGLRVDRYVNVGETNLDIPTKVTGQGTLGHINVTAPDCEVEMLPDTIVVRPGINADVSGEEMDSVAAEESSEEPRILGGYPVMHNVSPKSAEVIFSTNKKGTIHWALTAMTDGSLSAEDLLSPESVAHKVIKSGKLPVKDARKELPVKLTSLTRDGSYYVSAVLVDNRDHCSQVKVIGFTTPDDSTPAFASGYPQALLARDRDGKIIVQSTVMANKSCRLYYALMPKGSSAPTAADFRTAALTGTLGWGQMDVIKNTPHMLARVNDTTLKEKTGYDLYLMLSDVDNGKNSPVKKLSVTTPDITPPVLQLLDVAERKDKSISMIFRMDEPGTLYWSVVKSGERFFEREPVNGIFTQEHLLQIENGVGALKKGSANVNKDLEGKFNITGLEPQTGYDLYFVVKDKAGNYGLYNTAELTPPMDIHTLDTQPPTVKQEFSHDGTSLGSSLLEPFPDTSIRLVFSERILGEVDQGGTPLTQDFLDLYQKQDFDALARALAQHIKLWRKPLGSQPELLPPRGPDNPNPLEWLVDFRKATVTPDPDSGEMIITLPNEGGLNLSSGTTYYFELESIIDAATPPNHMKGNRGVVRLPEFTTIDAQIIFSQGSATGEDANHTPLVFDMSFTISPVTTSNVADNIMWDLLFWSENEMQVDVYYKDESDTVWSQMSTDGGTNHLITFSPTSLEPRQGMSLSWALRTPMDGKFNPQFERLKDMQEDREYGIIVRSLGGVQNNNPDTWSGNVAIDVMAVSGTQMSMSYMAQTSLTPNSFDQIQQGPNQVKQLGVPEVYPLSHPFRDKTAPTFINGYPIFHPGDSGVKIDVLLSRGKTKYFYVVTEVGNIPTKLTDGTNIVKGDGSWGKLPKDGQSVNGNPQGNVTSPLPSDIINPQYQGAYVTGHGTTDGSVKPITIDNKLNANTEYVAYFVLQGESPESVSEVYAFGFKTEKVVRPVLNVQLNGKAAATITSKDKDGKPREADVRYMMVVVGVEGELLGKTRMEEYWNTAAEAEYNLTDPDLIKKYQSLTLIQAMATPYNQGSRNQGSVFDLFSNETIQNTMTSQFDTASPDHSSIVKVGDEKLTTSNKCEVTVPCKDAMTPGKQKYWFIAMGKSPLGSGSAFAAVKPLEWPEVTYMKVTTIGTEPGDSVTITNNYEKAINQPYTGTVTLSFDDSLYFNDNGIAKQVVDVPSLPPKMADQYYSSSLLTTGNNVKVVPQKQDKDYSKCNTLKLNFSNVKVGNTLAFSLGLCNEDGNYPLKSALQLKLKLVEDEKGFYFPTFYITTPIWDGTQP